jgi:hypothetical protein
MMMKNCVLFMCLFAALSLTAFPAQDVRPVYDARLTPKAVALPAAEESIVRREVARTARAIWGLRLQNCDSDSGKPDIIDHAQGSFTRQGASQTAILYRYCTTGHNFALDGIAIIEHDQIVSHLVYEGSWDNALGALPDLNGNGQTELLISTGGINMGETWGVVTIIELADNNVRKFGMAQTYMDNCGVAENEGEATAYRISARAGARPVFYREAFGNKDCGGNKDKWTSLGNRKQISLRPDEIKYRRVK